MYGRQKPFSLESMDRGDPDMEGEGDYLDDEGGPGFHGMDMLDDEELLEELEDYLSDEGDELVGFQPPELKMDLETAVIVNNLPKVGKEKYDKLMKVVGKITARFGDFEEESMIMPIDEATGETHGFAFVNYLLPEDAKKAVQTLNGWAMDKTHTLSVLPYGRLEQLAVVPEEYAPPEPLPFKPRADPSSWLADERHRDQFVVRYSMPASGTDIPAHETEVLWCEPHQAPQLCYGGEREKEQGKSWVELYVLWSPQGTYLASLHAPGIALWGGPQFEKQGRFAHRDVKRVDFSPCENYLLTCNFDDSDRAFIVWDVRSASVIRTFPMANADCTGPDFFKWSHDGKYIARKGRDLISIYELPGMNLLEKKSLKAAGVADFDWSPADNLLAYWAPEQDNTPARVSVVEIPSRRDVRQKNLFNVSECRLHWQHEGTYLCVKVLRHSKSKKTMYNNFELFRVKDSGIPVEMLELKDTVVAFAWEPNGDRFAIVHGGEAPRYNVTFWTMRGGELGNELTEVVTLEDKTVNHLYWSPQGQFILLAGMGDAMGANNGHLMFYDVEHQAVLKESEHFRVAYCEWDPSGRYLVTAVKQPIEGGHWKAQMDNGYSLWTFHGEQLFEFTKDTFYQIVWRPRPASLLSPDDKKKIIKNLKKYERKFERADKAQARRKRREALTDKVRLKKEFRQRLDRLRDAVGERRSEIVSLRAGYDSDDESHYVVEGKKREVVLSVKKEVV
jgi:translation initiation factor 3 subunit B